MATKAGACPRCIGGCLQIDRKGDDWYEYCINCAYTRDLAPSDWRIPVEMRTHSTSKVRYFTPLCAVRFKR